MERSSRVKPAPLLSCKVQGSWEGSEIRKIGGEPESKNGASAVCSHSDIDLKLTLGVLSKADPRRLVRMGMSGFALKL